MRSEYQRGLIAALGTYAFWGLVPIYFKWLAHVAPLEIIAQRVIWAALILWGVLALRERGRLLAALRLPPRQLAMLAVTGALVAANWLIFVWAVVNDQVLSASLGYFLNPLVNVLLGVIFLGERLGRSQWWATGLAAAGTAVIAWHTGGAPWLALGLAVSFGLYGLLRKQLDVGPLRGLCWETSLLAPLALGYMAWLGTPDHEAGTWGLLIGAGAVTVIPLLSFNYAAKRLPLSTIGFVQYLSPTVSFFLAVFVYQEAFDMGRLGGFALIWLGLAVLAGASMRRPRPLQT